MAIKVQQPGLSTTVQDAGRFGYYAIGMPPSGAMDQFSYEVGNYLVGNDNGEACLEITYFGPDLKFAQDAVVAVTGAEMPPLLNKEPAPAWKSFTVQAGDVLSFDYLRSGARAYLAVTGGIDVPKFLSSRSTYTLIGLGGYEGRALQAGDELAIGAATNPQAKAGRALPEQYIPEYPATAELRVVIGLCSYRLTETAMKEFLNTEWTVTSNADRIGYRYQGSELRFVEREQPAGAGSDPSNVVDLGYPIGSIQVPGGVEPIILTNDAVTGGGYATIGTVISADRDRLAQTKTNDRTRFRSVDLREALDARMHRSRQLSEIHQYLNKCAGKS